MTELSVEADLQVLVFLNSEVCKGYLRSLRVWWIGNQ